MERFIVEFGLRSVLIAGAAVLVLLVLKIRTAAAQHRIWTGVLVVMLALPVWIQWGPKAALPILPAPEPAVFANALTVQAVPSTIPAPVEIPGPKPSVWTWDAVLIGAYLLGAGALMLRLIVGTIRASRLTGDSCTTPVTVGVLRPRVILPNHWREWPQEQLDAILTHEQEHARRRDPLVQWLALLNRALFWFHPLAWWIERRLSALAEEACDAAVLAHGHDARSYSEYLLDMARAVQRAGVRIHVTGMAMPGSYLPQRIRKMIAGISATRVSPARMACAATACVICSAMFAAATLEHVAQIGHTPILPQAHAPSSEAIRSAAEPATEHTQTLFAQSTAAPRSAAQSATMAPPKFEVASIKPCRAQDRGGRGGGIGRTVWSPGRLVVECQPLERIIRNAYLWYPDGRAWPERQPGSLTRIPPISHRLLDQPIKGSPEWINSEFYTIEAKAEGVPTKEMMSGPMMQALLENRFQLKTHRETKVVPTYELVVAKGGPKLQPTKDGSCITIDRDHPPPPPGALPPRVCGGFFGNDMYGTSIANLCAQFSVVFDRDVVDKTGISGIFDIHFDIDWESFRTAPSEATPDLNDPDAIHAAGLRSALPRLGLELKPAKGYEQFLVIDHVERPAAN